LHNKSVAVLGYGAQGRPHALNLRDSGCRVLVAQRPGSPRFDQARFDGFSPTTISAAAQAADLLIFALPDESAPPIYNTEVAPHLRASQALGFLHGFNIHYRQLTPPADVDVLLVAPKGQGVAVRSEFLAGRGVAALIAIHQDATGQARSTALGWAAGIGSHRAAIYETTFADETETDLFGEQAVLCGGLTALISAAFETLVAAGYPTELAYFECCHEVKLIADLIYAGGIADMRSRISGTARFGDLTRGPRIIGSAARRQMSAALEEIRSGAFAAEWLRENATGQSHVRALLAQHAAHPLELVGRRIRAQLGAAQASSVAPANSR